MSATSFALKVAHAATPVLFFQGLKFFPLLWRKHLFHLKTVQGVFFHYLAAHFVDRSDFGFHISRFGIVLLHNFFEVNLRDLGVGL